MFKIQPIGWADGSAGGAITGGQCFCHPLGRPSASAAAVSDELGGSEWTPRPSDERARIADDRKAESEMLADVVDSDDERRGSDITKNEVVFFGQISASAFRKCHCGRKFQTILIFSTVPKLLRL